MYCSSCSASITQGLSYCNHCGAQLNGGKGDSLIKTTELRAESLIISAMVGLFVLGLDTLYVNAMLMLLTFGTQTGRTLYFESALVISLLGFVGTVALSKFLMRGEVIE